MHKKTPMCICTGFSYAGGLFMFMNTMNTVNIVNTPDYQIFR